ncbi:Csu type fimbrial protein [Burkholderia sp. TSV86]|uniref:Csu type fimbrial protein n=1 Tax=Burkholderia sp. TSV86 TaxID=1385594 RepID=UPI00075F28B0|nr:spore coat U domain-containing protein [Burkholderia sp. TSV86]KVE37908.1 spore coat protein U domain-contain protein [Burkholderia sp. TSV86]
MSTLQRAILLLGIATLPVCGNADTLLPRTQTFTVSAQIVAGCGVAGGGASSGLNFGMLDFGTYPAVATGQATASVGSGAVQIECAPGSTLKMTIDGGAHASAGNTQRNLASGNARIAYRLYSDPGRTQAIAIGQAVSVPVSGTITLPIYGALTLPGNGVPAGTYTDTAQVTLSY